MAASNQPTTTTETPRRPIETCDQTVEEHLELIVSALTLFSQGIGCAKTYQALLVLAELARRRHGHEPYDPTEMVNRYMVRAAELEAEKAGIEEWGQAAN